MDVPVYAVALFLFALLYLALAVFLVFALVITLVVILAYLATRYGRLPEGYPYGKADTAITVIFIGITWGIFAFLGPKNPIPFVGQGLTYSAPSFPLSSIVAIVLAVALGFLAAFSFFGREGSEGSEGERPQQRVGA
jgi:membrane protease YdiL (CAAX protease family)